MNSFNYPTIRKLNIEKEKEREKLVKEEEKLNLRENLQLCQQFLQLLDQS